MARRPHRFFIAALVGVRGFNSFEQSISEQQRLADKYGDSPAAKRAEAENKYLNADCTFNSDGIFDYTTK